jgi:hypothetical protein
MRALIKQMDRRICRDIDMGPKMLNVVSRKTTSPGLCSAASESDNVHEIPISDAPLPKSNQHSSPYSDKQPQIEDLDQNLNENADQVSHFERLERHEEIHKHPVIW